MLWKNPVFKKYLGGDDIDDDDDCEDDNDDYLKTWNPSPRSLVSGIRPEISGRGPGVSEMGGDDDDDDDGYDDYDDDDCVDHCIIS